MGLLNKKNIKNVDAWPNPYNIKREDTRDTEFEDWPIEIIALALCNYKLRRGEHHTLDDLLNAGIKGAFPWDDTDEGWDFWNSVKHKKFDVFYKKYDYKTLSKKLRQ